MKYSSYSSTFSLLFLSQILFTLFPVVFSSFRVTHARSRTLFSKSFPRQSIPGPEPVTREPLEVIDPTCKHSEQNPYEIEYNEDEIRKVSLFRKDFRLESYVGYPCNVELFNDYDKNFQQRLIDCPFRDNLDAQFQEFIWSNLSAMSQIPFNDTGNITSNQNTSLLFQYICFSNQYERCVLSEEKKNATTVTGHSGSCDGICECMDEVPVQLHNYPHITNENNNRPKLLNENEIRCGVQAGGLCFPVWDSRCKPNETGYNKTLETMYKKTDFYFKCESNAGCHTTKRVCECAQGHQCGLSGSDQLFHFNYLFSFIFWILAIIMHYYFLPIN